MLLRNVKSGFIGSMRIKRTQLVVEIPHDLRTRLKVVAASRGITLRDLLLPAITQIAAEENPTGDSEKQDRAR